MRSVKQRTRRWRGPIGILAASVAVSALAAACGSPTSKAAPVTYTADVQPIILANCATCHVEVASGGLSLATYASLMKGGDNGPVIEPGNASSSLLYQYVSQDIMPEGGPYLSQADDTTIYNWIQQGAKQ